LTKAIVRLILLIKYQQGLQRNQSVIPLDRARDLPSALSNRLDGPLAGCDDVPVVASPLSDSLSDQCMNGHLDASSSTSTTDASVDVPTFTLKRSGRVMRTIEKAPPRWQRTWLSPGESFTLKQLLEKHKRNAPPSDLSDNQLIGEVLHIVRPVAHLATVSAFGKEAWAPYLVALGLDVTSLKLLSEPHDKLWNINERMELGQRSMMLLLYLLRSPFYDRFTKERLLSTLRFFSDHIPLFGRLINPLINYLPEWQKTYFYVWGV